MFDTHAIFVMKWPPQQPKDPIILTPIQQYPFQQICADYFEMSGYYYLSIVDRFSRWLNMYHYPPRKTIADTLISTSRAVFVMFVMLCLSVQGIMCCDGGTPFMSTAFQNFLTKWGVTLDCHLLNSHNQTAEQNWV